MHAAFGYLHAQLVYAGGWARRLVAGQSGQGTVEYVALVTLVALVMFGVITAMKSYKFAEGQQLALLLIKKIEDAVSKVHY